MTIYLKKVTKVSEKLNNSIVGLIVFPHMDFFFFLDASVFKESYDKIQKDGNILPSLTRYNCNKAKMESYIKEGHITLETYEFEDNSTPDSIVPLVF